MSHHHCEIILPTGVEDVPRVVGQVLAPFSEHNEDASHAFWDWYTIGGRWSGEHILQALDQSRVELFSQKLYDMGITVSAVQFGKQTLQPASQREQVDALWRQWFPESELEHCPLFAHFPLLKHDIATLEKVPHGLCCHRLIICHDLDSPDTMLSKDFWNGVSWQEATWDGTLKQGLEIHAKIFSHRMPSPGAVVVTVDCHS